MQKYIKVNKAEVAIDNVQLETIESEMSGCTAVGTSRRGKVVTSFGDISVDVHYNLYKKSVVDFEGQRDNTIRLMESYGVIDFVSTALFYGTTNVCYASKNGIRILGAGEGKRARLRKKYNCFAREQQLAADGIVCEPNSGIVPVTYSADCVTGVFCAPNGAYGVFHSMAKLLAGNDNIIRSMVKAFKDLYGIEAKDLELVLYPSASHQIYEVDEEFAKSFNESYVIREEGKKPRLNLEKAALAIARDLGVYQVMTTGHSTAWTGQESLRGSEKAFLSGGGIGNVNGQNILFAIPKL